jgi:OmpR-family two-component system manganese-sensing sensor histidine kinase
MFKNIRYRLLLSYLLILASILSIFAVGVRVIFGHSLRVQLLEKLTALGQGAAANVENEDGKLKIESDFKTQKILNTNQAIQWFDLQGNLINQQGKFVINLPLSKDDLVQIQTGKTKIEGLILPIIESDNGKLIGYVRVSQSLEEMEETLKKLDWGLGIGILSALILSGIGGIILTNQAMQPIEESFQRLKQFTADASHELRGPLMAIESNVSLSLKYPEGMREMDRESFNAIASATTQMTHLTEDLLLLARTERISTPKKDKVNLTIIIEELYRRYQAQAQQKKIDLKMTLNEPLFVSGDSSQLQRLLSNLIENALYYTPEKGLIEIEGRRKGSSIEIQVKDRGIGIASEDLDKIFERFWRADRSRSYHSGGSGLGLAIAQTIALQHQGKITVSSQVGMGSCFQVILPVRH